MAKFWQARVSRRGLFAGSVAALGAAFAGKWLMDRFGGQPAPLREPGYLTPSSPGFIDVREFKKSMTVEALNKTAEGYFAGAKNWDQFLAKPIGQIAGAPDLLNNVSHLLRGLDLLPGMTVLDFGAASCWLTRWLTQLGMEAIGLDVSATALEMGRELYARQPVIGPRPPPRFLHFDGHRIDLPDASVDRILVLDVFHHLLNPDEVLREMSRILKPGGIAGFSEPGPRHSRSPGAQFEMRNFKVLEDDVDIHRIWQSAQQAGFQRLRIAVLNSQSLLLGLDEFDDYIQGGWANRRFTEMTWTEMQDRRMFFLHRTAQPPAYDSRGRIGIEGKLEVSLPAIVKAGQPLSAQATVTNSGRATWLPHSAPSGAVWLYVRLLDASGTMINSAFVRQPLTPGQGRAVEPGETLQLEVRIPPLSKGSHVLEFDLVGAATGSFAYIGGVEPVRSSVQVQ
jgi:SAM-dependent methyltransferase